MKKTCLRQQAGFTSIIILLGITVIVLIGGVMVYQKVLAPKTNLTPTTTQPSPAADTTASWETYTNYDLGIQLKIPKYIITKSEVGFVQLSLTEPNLGSYSYLEISKNLIDYSAYPTCENEASIPCLNGKSWQQSTNIANMRLNDKTAESIYYTEGVDGDFRVIQTVNAPFIQVKMYIAGGGLDQTFNQILSTFKFLD